MFTIIAVLTLTASMEQKPSGGYGGISSAPSPKAISPEEAAALMAQAAQDEPKKPVYSAYDDEVKECTLVSGDGEEFKVPSEYAKQAILLKNMLEDGDDGENMPLPNVKASTLRHVIDYMTFHGENPEATSEVQKPLKSTDLKECGVNEFDVGFVGEDNMTQEVLFEVILAANYMDIKPLLDLTCAKVASMIKGQTSEQIRKRFNIVNDFTPEEEAQVREENRWCEDA